MKTKNLLKQVKLTEQFLYDFHGTKTLPYKYKVLKIITFDNARACCEAEHQLHNKYKNHSYKHLIKFKGDLECYNTGIRDLVDD